MRRAFGKRLISGFLAGIMTLALCAPAINVSAANPADTKRMDRTRTTDTGYINDTPIRLQVSKVKTHVGDHEGILPEHTSIEAENTITYKISGRVEGTEQELIRQYGAQNIELAHKGATYLGYGWLKGTYEYLVNRQALNLDEDVEIQYDEDGSFAGYAYVTRRLETTDNPNRYVAGATMALYDAIEIEYDHGVIDHGKREGTPSFDDPNYTEPEGQDDWREDERFIGVTVKRNSGSNDVVNVYVEKGYAGNEVMYVKQKRDEDKYVTDRYDSFKYTAETPQTYSEMNNHVIDENYHYSDEINDTDEGVWVAQTVMRDATPILYYSFDNLHVTTNDIYVANGASNNALIDKYYGSNRFDPTHHTYGYDKSRNVVDITQIKERDFTVFGFVDESTIPTFEFVGGDFTKIRYNEMEKRFTVGEGTVIYHLDNDGNRDSMVDPQTGIAYIRQPMLDEDGNEIEKILVWPVNVDYDASGSDNGNANGSKTFRKILTNRIAAINADTADEYTTGTFDGAKLRKSMNSVLDIYGHPVYYRRSDQTYTKGQDYWDYDEEEYLGWKYTDRLDNENEDAYSVNNHSDLYNGDADNPFDQQNHYQFADKQDVVVVVDSNNYIVNGKSTVPVPTREGFKFAGWMITPNNLTDDGLARAQWNTSTGMNATMRDRWYSDRGPTGTTRQITVTFDANGGTFDLADGDQNSTDNILYHRLGESIIIDNIWMTGENTPNDPFDEQKVDTVHNTAAGTHTITANGKTANDVYSDVVPGGMADMLKRVHVGNYIMEELIAPDGYSKGLPVGVSVYEKDTVQQTEMVDKTIKVELIKEDAASKTDYGLYIDGIKQYDSGAEVLKRMSKGAYTYTHVPGAVLSMKGTDAETKRKFSDWVQITSDTDFTKKNDGTYYYIEFDTSLPLFMEGIPKGNYEITEVNTPSGFVTMDPQRITVKETEDVQIFTMTDDHTRVMIEKYVNDDGSRIVLPNAYHAHLQLLDSRGQVFDEWNTDDAYIYTGTTNQIAHRSLWGRIVELFMGAEYEPTSMVQMFNNQVAEDPNYRSIDWMVVKTAVKLASSEGQNEIWLTSDGDKIVFEDGRVPASAPEDFKEGYSRKEDGVVEFTYQVEMHAEKNDALSRTLADQVWDVSNGTQMHVSVYPTVDVGQSTGVVTYTADFMFNYKKLAGNAISYDNTDGLHVIEYIPTGNYTLHESEVPEGFVRADDKAITVNETEDVQQFTMENKRRKLSIVKTVKVGDKYFAGDAGNGVGATTDTLSESAVMKGAELTLYYSTTPIADYQNAFKNSNKPAGAVMKDRWVSGTEGKYTADDVNNGKVYRYDEGDYKRHDVTDLSNGYYYIVETETPAYYKTADVIEVKVDDNTTADNLGVVHVINEPVPLTIKVRKQDEETMLEGATFTIRNKTTGDPAPVGTITTGADGTGTLTIADIGRLDADGNFVPYTFTAQETVAPAGYQLDDEIHQFTPKDNIHEGSTIIINTADADIAEGWLTVEDSPSYLQISKYTFGGEPLPGASFEVYEANYNIEKGEWQQTNDEIRWSWTVGETGWNNIYGLTAGQVYVIKETVAPNGYTMADDLYFRVSESGRSIDRIWHDKKENPYVRFELDSTGAAERVTVSGRAFAGTYVTLKDLTDTSAGVVNKGTLTTGYIILTDQDIINGHRYQLEEYAVFSDGTKNKLVTTTFVANLKKEQMQVNLIDVAQNVTVKVEDTEGNEVISFNPTASNMTRVIENGLTESTEDITVVKKFLSHKGVDHSAVQEDDTINYRITYEGKDTLIEVIPDPGMNYGDLWRAGFEEANGRYYLTTTKDSGEIEFRTVVNQNAVGSVIQKVMIGDRMVYYMNPVAVNHGDPDTVFFNTSKLVISSEVKGSHPDNENAAFTFKITLTNEAGQPLQGEYDYRTKDITGTFSAYGNYTDFEVIVHGNDYIVINDLPYNTKYSVVQVVPSKYDFVVDNTTPTGVTNNTSVSNVRFTNTRNATNERNTFQKNKRYILTESLDHSSIAPTVLMKFGFAFDNELQVEGMSIYDKTTHVVLYKYDTKTGDLLDGAVYEITKVDEPDDTRTAYITNGTLVIDGELKHSAEYNAHEITPPKGYSLGDDVRFTVSDDGSIDNVLLMDDETYITIDKVDLGYVPLQGAEMILYKINDDNRKEQIANWTTEKGAPERIEQLEVGRYYVLHEHKAAKGYTYARDIKFYLNNYGKVTVAYFVDENGDRIGNENADVDRETNLLYMKDTQIVLEFSKQDFAGSEVPNATCEIRRVNADGTTTTIETWTSGTTPHIIRGSDTAENTLEIGQTYRFHENAAPAGYEYSADIEFTIGDDGKPMNVHYVNDAGQPELYDKYGYETEIVVNDDGTYSLGEKTITITAGGDAIDEEGNTVAEGVRYEIDVNGENGIMMKDSPTEFRLIKTDEEGGVLAGAEFQILDVNLQPVLASKDTHIPSVQNEGQMIKQGEPLIFASTGNEAGVLISNILISGRDFILRETKAPKGYIPGPDMKFSTPYKNTREDVVVTATNKKTRIPFIKKDFAGEELPGAFCQIIDEDGNVVNEWESETTPHTIEGLLEVGKTYHYHEEVCPDGYGYSQDIIFTVDNNGKPKDIVYVDENGNKILYDKDQYPTTIIAHEDGTYTDNGVPIHIDINGNAVDDEGNIHAEGVGLYFDTEGGTVVMRDAPTQVTLLKENISGKRLAGGIFQIINMDGTPTRALKDTLISSTEHAGVIKKNEVLKFKMTTTGINYTGQLRSGTAYLLREVQAPSGHVLSEDVEFKIPYLNQKEPLAITMKDKPTYVEFVKTDFTTTQEVPGAFCQILDKNGEVVVIDGEKLEWYSTNEAHVIKGKLEAGETYYYHEDLNPIGYGYANDIEFLVEWDGSIQKIEMKDKPTTVEFSKTDFATSEELPGAFCQILDGNGNVVTDQGGNKLEWYSTTEPHVIVGILQPDTTYYYHEEINPDGYGFAEDIAFTVNHDGSTQRVEMKDKPTDVWFYKTDYTTSEEVEGAFCQIKDQNGEVVVDKNGEKLEWTSTKEAHRIYATLQPGQTYYYHEDLSPIGYAYAQDVEFVVNMDGSMQKVVMQDKPTEVWFSKIDLTTAEELPGAFCQILDKNGNVIIDADGIRQEWYSTTEPHIIKGVLVAGETYYYHEEGAPDGYGYAEDVEFTVNKDGTIQKVVLKDKPTIVEFTKTDITTAQELPGAFCQILDKNGKVLKDKDGNRIEWYSTTEPYILTGVLKAGETYYYHEEGAPNGYGYAEDVMFRVNLDGSVQKVELKDSPVLVELVKVNKAGKQISGGQFQVIRQKTGKVILDNITINGTFLTEKTLEAGETYIMHEVKAPSGYKLAEDVTFTIPKYLKNGEVITVTMTDEKKPTGGSGSSYTPSTYTPTKSEPEIVSETGQVRTGGNGVQTDVAETLVYHINYKNYKTYAADIIITDTLDLNVAFVSADNNGVCNNGTVTWELKNVPAGRSGYVELRTKVLESAREPGKVLNTAYVKVGNDAAVRTNTIENPVPDRPSKTEPIITDINGHDRTGGHQVATDAEEILTYNIYYRNYEQTATDVYIRDPLDEHVKFVSADQDGYYENGTVYWILRNVPAGQSGHVTLRTQVLESAREPGEVINTAYVRVGNNAEQQTDTIINPVPEGPKKVLESVTAKDGTERAGRNDMEAEVDEILTYRIHYKNSHKDPVRVTIIDTLDPNVEFVSASKGGEHDDGEVTWVIDEVDPGESGYVTLKVKVLESAMNKTVENEAKVQVGNDAQIITNKIITRIKGPKKEITEIQDLDGNTRPAGNEAAPGEILTFRINFSNHKDTASTITIIDTMDKNLEFVSADHDGVLEDNKVTWTLKNVPGNLNGYVLLKARVKESALEAGSVENTALINNDAVVTTTKATIRIRRHIKGVARTGESNEMLYLGLLMLISMIGSAVLYKKRKSAN